jgi:hypothetical protein
MIWTTTPWTLPANLAIALNPSYEYSAVRVNGKGYIVATELLKAVSEKCGWSEPDEVARFSGRSLEKRMARHPFIDRESVFVLGNYVTLDAGTGCVHTAPGHPGAVGKDVLALHVTGQLNSRRVPVDLVWVASANESQASLAAVHGGNDTRLVVEDIVGAQRGRCGVSHADGATRVEHIEGVTAS